MSLNLYHAMFNSANLSQHCFASISQILLAFNRSCNVFLYDFISASNPDCCAEKRTCHFTFYVTSPVLQKHCSIHPIKWSFSLCLKFSCSASRIFLSVMAKPLVFVPIHDYPSTALDPVIYVPDNLHVLVKSLYMLCT